MPVDFEDRSRSDHPVMQEIEKLHQLVNVDHKIPDGMMVFVVATDGHMVAMSTPSWPDGAVILYRAAAVCAQRAAEAIASGRSVADKT